MTSPWSQFESKLTQNGISLDKIKGTFESTLQFGRYLNKKLGITDESDQDVIAREFTNRGGFPVSTPSVAGIPLKAVAIDADVANMLSKLSGAALDVAAQIISHLKTSKRELNPTIKQHQADTTKQQQQLRNLYKVTLPESPLSGRIEMALLKDNPILSTSKEFNTYVDEIVSTIKQPHTIGALQGPSGCGKTTLLLAAGVKEWGFYVEMPSLEEMLPKLGQDSIALSNELKRLSKSQPIQEIEAGARLERTYIAAKVVALILLYLNGVVKTPEEWLYCQLNGAARWIGDLFKSLLALDIEEDDIASLLSAVQQVVFGCTNGSFLLLIDEAQLMSDKVYGNFWKNTEHQLKPNPLNSDAKELLAKTAPADKSAAENLFYSFFQVFIRQQLPRNLLHPLIGGIHFDLSHLQRIHSAVAIDPVVDVAVFTQFPYMTSHDVNSNLNALLNLKGYSSTLLGEMSYWLMGRGRFSCGFPAFVARNLVDTSKEKVTEEGLTKLFRKWVAGTLESLQTEIEKLTSRDVTAKQALLAAYFIDLQQEHREKATLSIDAVQPVIREGLLLFTALPPVLHVIPTRVEEEILESNPKLRLEPLFLQALENIITPADLITSVCQTMSQSPTDQARSSSGDVLFAIALFNLSKGGKIRLDQFLEGLWKVTQNEKHSTTPNLPAWIKSTFIPVLSGPRHVTLHDFLVEPQKTFGSDYYKKIALPEMEAGADVVTYLVNRDDNPVGILSAQCAIYPNGVTQKKVKQHLRVQMVNQYTRAAMKESEPEPNKSAYDEDGIYFRYNQNIKAQKKLLEKQVELPERLGKAPETVQTTEAGVVQVVVDKRNLKYLFPEHYSMINTCISPKDEREIPTSMEF